MHLPQKQNYMLQTQQLSNWADSLIHICLLKELHSQVRKWPKKFYNIRTRTLSDSPGQFSGKL